MTQAQPNPLVISEKIHIKSITITNAQVHTAPGQTTESWDNVEFKLSTQSKFAKDTNDCKVIIATDFRKQDDDGIDIISANFTIEFDFNIENLSDFRTVKEESPEEVNIHIRKELGIKLMSIVYSTARGIILTRTAGTVLDGIILPVIDPESILD